MNRRNVFRALGMTVVAAAMVGCAGGQDAPLEPPGVAQMTDYRLGAGDALRVIVFGEEQLSGEFRVDGSGKVAMPLIGEVNARGHTPRELEADISKRLSQGYVRDAKVSVEVLNHRPFFILGEVRNPGQYQYVNGMTALSAVAMAGGYTYRAKEDYVLITRGADPKKELRRAPITTPVMPDDVLRVPERYF
ncbi:polysaccharide biosynthesis protein [Azospirillum baldaniorum]|uniref:Polysaccharide export protein n=1 Tax=Azospirillum baldaniorum TaxID=1064539 RepID=A0A9P1JSD1_9PROT|nr:polysaccharide biosynthesis/export family protein [Azospirillum baldaniorum]TWA80873.1 polysaccharide export outer membrane protein [Azospirillum brasilense]AWJ89284.1 polysaccharide biosynthesis protein [Azospirillum baldaniorum]NUB05623.1 polysaccharide export protein [Azospirillum baldaniorum]TWA52860.1 polysaccharide export outer membrane protein [Azospirillum baldaniorum]CCC98873.1 putative polysaccharide export protein [Azospirillum baldaniorum]